MPVSTNRRLVELTAHVAEAEKAWRDAAARRLHYIAHLIETGSVRTGYELGCALGLPWQQRAGRAYRLFRDAEALIASREPQEPQQDNT